MATATDWSQQQAKYGSLALGNPQKHIGGIKGFLVDALPAIGSGIGAVGGSFLAPVAGTIGGGAVGGAAGESLKRKLLGEKQDLGQIGIQALEGGALSSIGGAARGVKGGATALTKLGVDKGIQTGAEEAANTSGKSFLSKFTKNAATQGQQMQGRTAGINAGIGKGGKEIVPQDTERMLSTLKNEGIDTGNANNTLRDIADKQKIYGKQIGDHFKTNNNPLHPEDTKVIADNFLAASGTTDPRYLKEASILAQDLQKNVKSTKDLWKFRVGLDSRIPDSKQVTGVALSNQMKAIKDMRSYIADELGNIPGAKQYHDLSEIKPLVAKEANRLNNPGGGIAGRVLSSGIAQKIENSSGRLLEKAAIPKTDEAIAKTVGAQPEQNFMQKLVGAAANPLANPGRTTANVIGQEAGRGFGIPAAMSQTQSATDQAPQDVSQSYNGLLDTPTDQAQDYDPYAPENIRASIAQIQQQGGKQKDIAEFLSTAKAYNDLTANASGKPVSATAADAMANANAGLQSLQTIRDQLKNDPSVQGKEVFAQTFNPFGVTSRATGTGKYDAAITQAKDVIARLRTGAAISNSEEKRFTAMLPQPADSADVVNQKLNLLENALGTVAQRVGGNSADLIQEAAANQ